MQARFQIYFALLFALFLPNSAVQADPVQDVLFTQVQDENMDVQIAALRALQITLDLRMPEALFQLLNDEGNSIRRLAARGIGSRYWKTPEDRTPAFVEALQTNATSEFQDEVGMVNLAIALGDGFTPRSYRFGS